MNEPDEDDVILFRMCEAREPADGYPSELCRNPAVMRALLDARIVDPNAIVTNGDSLLMRAVYISNLAVASMLIEGGADVNTTCDVSSRSVLNVALLAYHPRDDPPSGFYEDGKAIIRLLLMHGARLTKPHRKEDDPCLVSLYQSLSALCILCSPLWLPRFNKSLWLSLDCIRLLHLYLD